MLNFLMSAAANPMTPVVLLCGVGIVIFVEAWKVSHVALMGDLYTESLED